jgi:hypothetical protein
MLTTIHHLGPKPEVGPCASHRLKKPSAGELKVYSQQPNLKPEAKEY